LKAELAQRRNGRAREVQRRAATSGKMVVQKPLNVKLQVEANRLCDVYPCTSNSPGAPRYSTRGTRPGPLMLPC